MDLIPWLVTALSLLVGCWVQTALGFGMAVIAAPIVVLVAPQWVPVVLTFSALVLSIFNTINQWQHIDIRSLLPAFVWRIPGTLFGAWLLIQLDVFWLQVAVSGSVLLAVLISCLGKQFQYTPARLGTAAFASGIMGTTTSVGGPPMALVMQHGSPPVVRANLSLYFGYSCTLSMLSYVYIGKVDTEILWASTSLIPVVAIGFLAGIRARAYVDGGRFRPLLLILCGSAGFAALLGALWQQLQ